MLRLVLVAMVASCASTSADGPPSSPRPGSAAVDPDDQPAPLDPSVVTGQLPNGLTYFVQPNHTPEHRAALWLVVRVGSNQEPPDQHGIAHLVEHVAFAGTKRFPHLSIVSYLEKAGMRFGADINARTTFDRTVYTLVVPTDDTVVVTAGLDMLRDFAADVSFDPAELDRERDVVIEERRARRTVGKRLNETLLPTLYAGSPYTREPIGDPEAIKGTPRDKLVGFYRTWYRPDLMAVVAVGDLDAKAIAKAIESKFGDLAKPATPRPPTAMELADRGLAVATASDPDVKSIVMIKTLRKQGRYRSRRDVRRFVVDSLVELGLKAHFREVTTDPASPLAAADVTMGTSIPHLEELTFIGIAKADRLDDAIAALTKEIARVAKVGFAAKDFELGKAGATANLEQSVKEPPASSQIASHLENRFMTDMLIDPTLELRWQVEVIPSIRLDEVNAAVRAWLDEHDRSIVVVAASPAALPSEARIRELVHQAAISPAPPLASTVDDRPLAVRGPRGRVVSTAHDPVTDATTWTLKNGVTVIVKPTTEPTVSFAGWLPGGAALYSDAEYDQARFSDEVAAASGVDDFDVIALAKKTNGITSTVTLAESTTAIAGDSPADKLEVALILVRLQLTRPRRDEAAFARWKAERLEGARRNRDGPRREIMVWLTDGRSRWRPPTPEMIESVELDKVLELRKRALSDFGNLTFEIVGKVDLATLQPIVEDLLGGLPSAGGKLAARDLGRSFRPGPASTVIEVGSDAKARVLFIYSARDPWTLDGIRDAKNLEAALQIRLLDVLRHDRGGVYSVEVSIQSTDSERLATISFTCDPANAISLRDAALAEIRSIQAGGVSDDIVAKVAEQIRRRAEVGASPNAYWLSALATIALHHVDSKSFLDVGAQTQRITRAGLQAAAKHFLDPPSQLVVVEKPRP